MATTEQLRSGIGTYLQGHLMPKLDGTRQFLLGTVYGMAAGRMDDVLRQLGQHPAARALGAVKENGEVDLDAVYTAAYNQMKAQGKLRLNVPMIGEFVFDETDLQELYQCIKAQ